MLQLITNPPKVASIFFRLISDEVYNLARLDIGVCIQKRASKCCIQNSNTIMKDNIINVEFKHI